MPLLGLFTPSVAGDASDVIIDLACMKNEKTSAGSDDVTYQIYVTNGGTSRDTIDLMTVISGLYHGAQASKWDITIQPDVLSIEPAKTEIATLYVKASCGCEEGHEIEITVTGTSQSDSSVSDSVITLTTRGVDDSSAKSGFSPPDPAPSFSLSLDKPGTGEIVPEVATHYDLLLENTWEGTQSIYFTIPYQFSADWTIEFSPDVVVLDGAESRNVDLSIYVSKGVVAGEYDLTVMAVSNEAPSLVQSVPLKLIQQPDIEVTDVWYTSTDDEEGNEPGLIVQIRNDGTGAASEVEVLVTIDDDSLEKIVIEKVNAKTVENVSIPWEPEKKKVSASVKVDFAQNEEGPIEHSQKVEIKDPSNETLVDDDEMAWRTLIILMVALIVVAGIVAAFLAVRMRRR